MASDPPHPETGETGETGPAYESWLVDRLLAIYGGRPWIVAAEVDQGAVGLAAHLRDAYGAEVLAVGARPGVGDLDPDVPLVSIDLPPATTIRGAIDSAQAALVEPPPLVQADVDDWDPAGAARVIGGPLLRSATMLGRPTFGPRLAPWVALEDKVRIEPVLAEAGLDVVPREIVDADDRAGLLAAHRRLASPSGTVWAGDDRSGQHGGGEGTHWVTDDRDATALAERLGAYDRVRVLPFVEGVPCSIHGLVVGPDRIAAFRPCEMMTLRDRSARRFVYARASTHWDPSPADRSAMVGAARRVGEVLAERVGFRGMFTLDGVLGADGFVATEVNPRLGAALPNQHPTAGGAEIRLHLVNHAVIDGALADLDPAAFERWLVDRLDRDRQATSIVIVERAPDAERRGRLVADSDGSGLTLLEPVGHGDDQRSLASVVWGQGPGGPMLRIDEVRGLAVGPPSAPTLVTWLRAIDQAWAVGLPPLDAAPSIR
ncbi:MAG: hypothetical protein AAGA93_00960 [Actinomycetota bacterium]